MRAQIKPAIIVLALLTLITGVIYPLVITAIAQVAFPAQANGSLIMKDGQAIGSRLPAHLEPLSRWDQEPYPPD